MIRPPVPVHPELIRSTARPPEPAVEEESAEEEDESGEDEDSDEDTEPATGEGVAVAASVQDVPQHLQRIDDRVLVNPQTWGKPSRLSTSGQVDLSDIVRGVYPAEDDNETEDSGEYENEDEDAEEDSEPSEQFRGRFRMINTYK